ncbi:MAG: FG-GAP-like repeat-containing protein [Bacteroidales bacterium]|jgi:hypothetical protein|nr:FG-GAP-like repeat-containing protein [Bacteroidales bacterium]
MRHFITALLFVLLLACSEPSRFELLSPELTGVNFSNDVTESDSFNVMIYEYIYNGAGVGIGDLNNDGLQDLVFAGNHVSPRVYLNMGNFRFSDISANFEGLTNDQWYSGVAIADINSDRLPDIYITSTKDTVPEKCKNRLWINMGLNDRNEPWFREMADSFGIAHEGQSSHSAFFDYDIDGDLDLYVLNNTVNSRMNTAYREKMTDGSAQNNDRLFRNNGDNTFTDVTIEAGIIYEGFGLGLALGDVNKDGYPDLYISNDFISNDLLYINQRNGTFRNEISKYMSYQTKSSMGDDMADVNNDGYPDMFTLDMLPESYYKKRQTIAGFSYMFYELDRKFNFEHQYLRNMLHLHNGFMNGEMLPYSEAGQMVGNIFDTEWSWSPLFADYDNDGDKDLIVANGYPKDLTDKDWTRYKVAVYGSLADEKHVIERAPSIKVNNMAFENKDLLSFERRKDWLPDRPSYSYGAAFVDLDNDGDLDYVSNNLNDKAFILRNRSVEEAAGKTRYIRIKLTGKHGNTTALGAKSEIWCGGKYQFNEHFLSRGYASSVDPVVHFGLEGCETIDSIRITWPSTGYVTTLRNIGSNQTIEIDETNSVPPGNWINDRGKARLMFEKDGSILGYLHEQNDFPDFIVYQNIMLHKLSQIGPILATGDINGDGLADIIAGATNMHPTRLFIRQGNRFEEDSAAVLTDKKQVVESALAIIDIDNDGDNDIVAVAGGYESKDDNAYTHYLYRNNYGKFDREELPVPQFPASVIKPFDFDHDGDPDLFIGSRVKRGMVPHSGPSWLLINDNGIFSASRADEFNLGMVTDALWSDFDGDGWEDLIVTREWNTVALLKNVEGKELKINEADWSGEKSGLWYSITAGDFDNDGDDDYIVGNLGDNHRFTVNDKYPLRLYSIDVDLDGNIDPITTAYWKDKNDVMTEYPVNYLDELIGQSQYFQKMFSDYASFSYTSFREMISETIMERLEFTLKVNTTSSYVVWNNNGKMRWEKLPWLMQVAPLRKMIVRDLNNDGFPDVIAGGNDHTYDISTGYYDSMKGVVLFSKGEDQSFKALPPSQSGMLLNGMVESLLWIEGDTSLVVAGINRNKAVVYKFIPGNIDSSVSEVKNTGEK